MTRHGYVEWSCGTYCGKLRDTNERPFSREPSERGFCLTVAIKVGDDEGAQAHVKGLVGACLAMGLRFAGTHHPEAAAAVKEQLLYFLACKKLVPDARGSLLRLRASLFLRLGFRDSTSTPCFWRTRCYGCVRIPSQPSGPGCPINQMHHVSCIDVMLKAQGRPPLFAALQLVIDCA